MGSFCLARPTEGPLHKMRRIFQRRSKATKIPNTPQTSLDEILSTPDGHRCFGSSPSSKHDKIERFQDDCYQSIDLRASMTRDESLVDLHFPIPLPKLPQAPKPLHMLRMPTFADGGRSEETLPRPRSNVVWDASPLERISRGVVANHPGILNNPPPFNRYSSPGSGDGSGDPQKQAVRMQQEVLHLQHERSVINREREDLVNRLEDVTQKLGEMQHRLDQANEELVAQDIAHRQLENQRGTLNDDLVTAKRLHRDVAKDLRKLRVVHGESLRREKDRNEILQRIKWMGRGRLQSKIVELQQQVSNVPRHHREELELVQKLVEDRDVEISGLKEKVAERERQLGTLKAERKEETADLILAEQALYQETLELKQTKHELGDAKKSLETVRQNNQGLVREYQSLKQRLADSEDQGMSVEAGPENCHSVTNTGSF